MRLEATIWSAITTYFVLIGIVYAVVSGEPGGVALLVATAALGGLVAGWTWNWSRRHPRRISDRADADASDETGVVGIYPTASLRPIALAIGFTAIVVGIPIGSWMTATGVAILASQILLLVHATDT